MAFTPISKQDLAKRGATTLPNQPQIPAEDLKAEFDAPAKDVVAPAVNRLITELEAGTAAASVGATAPEGYSGNTVQAVINSVTTALDELSTSAEEAIADAHTHSNKIVLDKFSEISGVPTYAGEPLSTEWGSIGGTLSNQTDLKDALDAKANSTDLATVATTNSYNSLDDKPTIPDELADLSQDATHRTVTDAEKTAWGNKTTVSWTQQVTTGQKIAVVTIDGTPTDVYAPTGGTPGTGAVNSVNGAQGDVVLNQSDINDVTITSLADQDTLVRNGTSNKWENKPLADVALSGSYNDLSNKPTIPAAQVNADWNAASGVAQILNKPTIPAAQIQSDWNQSDTTAKDYIKNKPTQLGHHMIPNASLISSMAVAVTDITNDDVVSAYGVGTWSNVDAVQILTAVSVDDDGVGTWEDEDDWEEGSRTGWIIHSALHGILSDDDVEIEPVFKIPNGSSNAVGMCNIRIDDTITGTTGGVALKFDAPITVNGYAGVKLKRLRTNTVIV